jgi:hypothetical protein
MGWKGLWLMAWRRVVELRATGPSCLAAEPHARG